MRSLSHLLPNDQAAIMEYVVRIRDRFPDRVFAVTLFGSKSRGDTDAESDIDLLVLVDADGANDVYHGDQSYPNDFRSELWRIAFDISLDYNVVISPRVFDQARWAEARRIRLPLYRVIVADEVPLTPERVPI